MNLILDLGRNNFEGNIPISVFNLRTLCIVDLFSNKFNGTIKLDVIQRLPNLIVLGLSHNDLLIDDNIKDDHDWPPFPEIRYVMLAFCKLREIPSFLRN